MKLRTIAATAVGILLVGTVAVLAAPSSSGAATPPPIVAPAVTYQAPIVITAGGTYSGAWASTSTSTPAVTVATSQPVVIQDCAVKAPGTLIQVKVGQPNADVTVRGCYGEGVGSTEHRFIVFDGGWKRAVVENNDLVRTSGGWFHNATAAEVTVNANRVRDISGGSNYIQAWQFDKVTSSDFEISWNEMVNTAGQSRVEDIISLYASGGTPASPGKIHDNLLWGAWPQPTSSLDYSGGGIMHGDGSPGGGYVDTYSNTILGTSNYGVSIVGGAGFNVTGNTVIGCGCLPDGSPLASSANGGPVGLSFGLGAPTGSTMAGNTVGWWKPLRGANGSRNDSWAPSAGKNGNSFTGNTVYKPGQALTYADEQAGYDRWASAAAGRVIGRPSGGATTTTTVPATTSTTTTTTVPSTTSTTTTSTIPPPPPCWRYEDDNATVTVCPK